MHIYTAVIHSYEVVGGNNIAISLNKRGVAARQNFTKNANNDKG